MEKSAEQGCAMAMGNLGRAYLDGEGVEQDHRQAYYWCKRGAEAGDDFAQYLLDDPMNF